MPQKESGNLKENTSNVKDTSKADIKQEGSTADHDVLDSTLSAQDKLLSLLGKLKIKDDGKRFTFTYRKARLYFLSDLTVVSQLDCIIHTVATLLHTTYAHRVVH